MGAKGFIFGFCCVVWLVRLRLLTLLLAALGGIMLHPAAARAQGREVQTVWRLLDYVAVDYAGAVCGGRVTSTTEYAEMTEFSAPIRIGIAALPSNPGRPMLTAAAQRLEAAIASNAAPE